jgi:hypothetical protein
MLPCHCNWSAPSRLSTWSPNEGAVGVLCAWAVAGMRIVLHSMLQSPSQANTRVNSFEFSVMVFSMLSEHILDDIDFELILR